MRRLLQPHNIPFLLAAFVLVSAVIWLLSRPLPSDPVREHSGLRIHVDPGTGCQYLQSTRGGLTPRLDRDGRHICR